MLYRERLTDPLGIAAALLVAACANVSTSTGDGTSSGTSTDAGATTTTVVTTSGLSGAQGTGCVMETDLGVQLCTSTSTCPAVTVDQGAFPNCGFYVTNGVATMQCDCDGLMCPIGTPANCGQAAALLTTQTQLDVCEQLAEGRCIQPNATATPAASSTSTAGTGTGTNTGASSSCDQTCASGCSNDPTCLSLCGC